MQRYFFSISYRDKSVPDSEGVELPADVDLRRCAMYLAAKLRADTAIPAVQFPDCIIEVSNARGDLLLSVPVPA